MIFDTLFDTLPMITVMINVFIAATQTKFQQNQKQKKSSIKVCCDPIDWRVDNSYQFWYIEHSKLMLHDLQSMEFIWRQVFTRQQIVG